MAESLLATRRKLPEVYKLEGFYRKKGRTRELVTKYKTGLFRAGTFLGGSKKTGRFFTTQIVSL